MSTAVPFLIIGGGIGGLATALALAQAGRPAHVLERSPEFAELGAGIQLAPNATRVLGGLGLLDGLLATAVQPRRLVLMDARAGSELTALDLGAPFRERYGAPYVVTHRGDLLGLLLAACRDSPLVTLEAGKEVVDLGSGARVECADGSAYDAGALIGADGVRSAVRRLLSDDEPRGDGYVAYRGTAPVAEARPTRSLDDVLMWVAPDQHFVQYPLRSGELYNSVAVFKSPSHRPGEEAAEDWGTPAELETAFAGGCDELRSALALVQRDRRWPMVDREPIEVWSRGTVTLVGDAAHPMLQYLAQGGAQALEDAAALARCVATHGGQAEPAFAASSAERAPRAGRVQRSVRTWGEVCHVDGIGRTLRDALLARRAPDDYRDTDWLYGAPAS